jgi:hypothetical protein
VACGFSRKDAGGASSPRSFTGSHILPAEAGSHTFKAFRG